MRIYYHIVTAAQQRERLEPNFARFTKLIDSLASFLGERLTGMRWCMVGVQDRHEDPSPARFRD